MGRTRRCPVCPATGLLKSSNHLTDKHGIHSKEKLQRILHHHTHPERDNGLTHKRGFTPTQGFSHCMCLKQYGSNEDSDDDNSSDDGDDTETDDDDSSGYENSDHR